MTDGELYSRAEKVIPGGVNSPVRAFTGVKGTPLFVKEGLGSSVTASDGRKLVDFCCSWGAMILGHARAEVVEAISARAARGTTFGIATEDEVAFAERLTSLVPGLEKVRAVSSGTEAVMGAIRLARGFTGRNTIVKFDGCYHGHSDAMLVKSGSGILTMGESSSKGVPPGAVADTIVVRYNDSEAVRSLFASRGDSIAAVIVEPVAGNMGLVMPCKGFLETLREVTRESGALLICDEVIDGFRFAPTTWTSAFGGIDPDLVTLGKVIGGGLPLAAFGGKAKYMDLLAPEGPVYQAGTLSGNPLAVAAGMKTIEILIREKPYWRMSKLAEMIENGVNSRAREIGLPVTVAREGGVFTLFASASPVSCLDDAKGCDTALYARIFHTLYSNGVYIAPSQFEVNFVSAAHSEGDAARLLAAFRRV